MSLGNDSNGTTMLVQPAGYYGGNGNGFGGGMLPMMMGGMGMGGFGGFV